MPRVRYGSAANTSGQNTPLVFFDYIEVFRKRQGPHLTLDHVSPAAFEHRHQAASPIVPRVRPDGETHAIGS